MPKKPSQNICGPRVRVARRLKSLTQEQLAVACQLADWDITQHHISAIERQVYPVRDYELVILARILEVTEAWLLGKE